MKRIIYFWIFEWLWCLSNMLIKPRTLSYHTGFSQEVRYKRFDNQLYNDWKKTNFEIKSDFGYRLHCELIEPDNEKEKVKKVAILCHGFGCAKYNSIKYAQLFAKLGYTILMYDHRNHGMSGKAYTSMGYYEKYDLRKIIAWCKNKYGSECKIITHGESMGAATVLLQLEIDTSVDCVIADCAYSDLKKLLRHQMKQFYHLPRFIVPIENLLIYLRAGFWFWQVAPIRAIQNSKIPVMFIHGKRDNYVPVSMSKEMYRVKKKNKAIYLVAKAKHAESYYKNQSGYEERVKEFLEKYLNQ